MSWRAVKLKMGEVYYKRDILLGGDIFAMTASKAAEHAEAYNRRKDAKQLRDISKDEVDGVIDNHKQGYWICRWFPEDNEWGRVSP